MACTAHQVPKALSQVIQQGFRPLHCSRRGAASVRPPAHQGWLTVQQFHGRFCQIFPVILRCLQIHLQFTLVSPMTKEGFVFTFNYDLSCYAKQQFKQENNTAESQEGLRAFPNSSLHENPVATHTKKSQLRPHRLQDPRITGEETAAPIQQAPGPSPQGKHPVRGQSSGPQWVFHMLFFTTAPTLCLICAGAETYTSSHL